MRSAKARRALMNVSLAWTIVPAPRANAEGHVAAVHESGNGAPLRNADGL
jgi:hypothetical protein